MTIEKNTHAMFSYESLNEKANNGDAEQQYLLASKIIATRTDESRLIEAYKWLFLSTFLKCEKAQECCQFLANFMTMEQIEKGNKLVDEWLAEKDKMILECSDTNLSLELKSSFGGKEARSKQLH
jgi:hypothetical protein